MREVVPLKIRTIAQAYEDIKADDPNTAITEYRIRKLVIDGVIPSTKSGTKYLINLDTLQKYFMAGGV